MEINQYKKVFLAFITICYFSLYSMEYNIYNDIINIQKEIQKLTKEYESLKAIPLIFQTRNQTKKIEQLEKILKDLKDSIEIGIKYQNINDFNNMITNRALHDSFVDQLIKENQKSLLPRSENQEENFNTNLMNEKNTPTIPNRIKHKKVFPKNK